MLANPSVRRRLRRALLLGTLCLTMIAPASGKDDADALLQRFQKMVRYNLDNDHVVPSAKIEEVMKKQASLSLGDRIAAWAAWFNELGKVEYLYGRDPGGYVTEGRICQDYAMDCVLFMYRVTELARSTSAEEAVQFAFGTRFYGASIEAVVSDDGRVNYNDSSHFEYSEEMIQSGIWGKNVTAECGHGLLEAWAGAGKPLQYVPADSIDYQALQSGDIVWFVGGEAPGPTESTNTVVHHIGIIDRRGGSVDLLHAAVKPLPGFYDRAGAARVPLRDYLQRVDRFKGIAVTRLVEF